MLFERSEFIECFGKSCSRPLSQDVFAPFFCFRFLLVMKENEEMNKKMFFKKLFYDQIIILETHF